MYRFLISYVVVLLGPEVIVITGAVPATQVTNLLGARLAFGQDFLGLEPTNATPPVVSAIFALVTPCGKKTTPPTACAAVIAFVTAAVEHVLPLRSAPKAVTSNQGRPDVKN